MTYIYDRLRDLIADFARDFPEDYVLPLPVIIATISASSSRNSDNHFYAMVVDPDRPLSAFGTHLNRNQALLLETYHEVIRWMLKRNLLVTLHLRIRIVATPELKDKVTSMREARSKARQTSDERLEPISGLRKASKAHPLSRSSSALDLDHLAFLPPGLDDDDEQALWDEADEPERSHMVSNMTSRLEARQPSMIADPGKPTPQERRWLAAMSIGKDPEIVTRFARQVHSLNARSYF